MSKADLAVPDVSIMLVSEQGVGKTTMVSTFPKPFVLDFDKGTTAIESRLGPPGETWDRVLIKDSPAPLRGRKVPADPKRGIFPYGEGWNVFLKTMDSIVDRFDDWPWQTLVWDSMTFLQQLCMNNTLHTAGRPGAQPQLQDYGVILNAMKMAVDMFTAWPGIKIMTAHVERGTNPITTEVEKLPMGMGQFPAIAPMYFDEIYFLDIEAVKQNGKVIEHKRTLRTMSSAYVKAARSRKHVPDGTLATWQAIEPYVRGIAK